MKSSFASLSIVVLSLFTRLAHAQAPGEAPSAPPASAATERPDPSVAITVSPLHLVIPMAEVTAEIRIAKKLGVSVIGGLGTFHDPDTNDRIDLLEGGASARYYLTGSFRTGLQLGAEAVYVHASTQDMTVDIKARGLGLSPFVGYKWTHGSGFTLEGQLGASFLVARAESSTATAEASKIAPMLNLNVGWSL